MNTALKHFIHSRIPNAKVLISMANLGLAGVSQKVNGWISEPSLWTGQNLQTCRLLLARLTSLLGFFRRRTKRRLLEAKSDRQSRCNPDILEMLPAIL